MPQVKTTAERTIGAPADTVRTAIADYTTTRPTLLTSHFTEYEVRDGGTGAGTTVHWKLAATSKRVRDCLIEVTQPTGDELVERDANSSMVTTWTTRPSAGNTSTVTITTTWTGATGIGGFFERTFAPAGLRRIYDAILGNLDRHIRR